MPDTQQPGSNGGFDEWKEILAKVLDAERTMLGEVMPPPSRIEDMRDAAHAMLRSTSPLPQAVDTILALLLRGTVHTPHPRYFGLFNPAPLFPGQVADLITTILNPQLAVWTHAPAAVEIEQAALAAFAKAADIPFNSAHFTSGGGEANHSAVLVALAARYPEVVENGVGAAGPLTFYISADSHLAWIKIAKATGVGRKAARLIATVDGAMDPAALSASIAEDLKAGSRPFMVAATAGTTGAGVVDPIDAIADICDSQGLHLHVDAAWAGAALLSPKRRGVFCGLKRAHSITIDAHKWLSQPVGAGMFFTSEAEAAERAFDVATSYMPPSEVGVVDYYRMTMQWSRRFIGLKLFLTLATLGTEGLAQQIERDFALGELLRMRLKADGWTIINKTPLPVICFTDPARDGDWHKALVRTTVESGAAWISTIRLGSTEAIRTCITSYHSRESDVLALCDLLARYREKI